MANSIIHIRTICQIYDLTREELEDFQSFGLIKLKVAKNELHLLEDELSRLEKVINLKNDLNINLEGIDVIFELLDKLEKLKSENLLLVEQLNHINQ